jgi:hypothetical protein
MPTLTARFVPDLQKSGKHFKSKDMAMDVGQAAKMYLYENRDNIKTSSRFILKKQIKTSTCRDCHESDTVY